MKRYSIFIILGILFGSCAKESSFPAASENQEVILVLDDNDINTTISTKATAVTSIPAYLYCAATTGTAGSSEARKYDSANYTVNGDRKIHTGKFQTSTPTAYNWYVSNVGLSVPASGAVTISIPNNNTDIIAGVQKATGSIRPAVTLKHIFARTGILTLNTQQYSPTKNYVLDNVSWKIESKAGSTGGTAGTYNIGTDTYSGITALSQVAIGTRVDASSNDDVSVHSSDLYCLPGDYVVTISFRIRMRNDDGSIDYEKTFTRVGEVTLKAGKVNNITATAVSGNAQEIIISCSLEDWGTNDITIDSPAGPEMVDLGLPSGLKWAKTNIGADSETDYGLYFKWGETEGKTSAEASYFSGSTVADGDFQDAATAAYGAGYRMPTSGECNELLMACWYPDTINGIKGIRVENWHAFRVCSCFATKYLSCGAVRHIHIEQTARTPLVIMIL